MTREAKAMATARETKPKRKRGRPTDYRSQYAEQAARLCELGATDEDLARFFKVDVRTIYRWQTTHDQFCQALKAGKEPANERVVRSLYQRAVGFRHEAVKIFMPAGADKPVYAPFEEFVPPDTTAAIFWLKNRRAGDWRDKQEMEHSGTVTLEALIAASLAPSEPKAIEDKGVVLDARAVDSEGT